MWPLGVLALADAMAARTSSKPSPCSNIGSGFISTRTAGSALPPGWKLPTPLTLDSCCCRTLVARSNSCGAVRVFDVSARIMIGWLDGLNFR